MQCIVNAATEQENCQRKDWKYESWSLRNTLVDNFLINCFDVWSLSLFLSPAPLQVVRHVPNQQINAWSKLVHRFISPVQKGVILWIQAKGGYEKRTLLSVLPFGSQRKAYWWITKCGYHSCSAGKKKKNRGKGSWHDGLQRTQLYDLDGDGEAQTVERERERFSAPVDLFTSLHNLIYDDNEKDDGN